MKAIFIYEESQKCTKAAREAGHEAYSCDIQDCSGGHPEWHIKADARTQLPYSKLNVSSAGTEYYDLVVSFPPCTDLAVSGSRWFEKKRLSGEQEASVDLFLDTWFYSHCTENPIGIMNNGGYIKKWFPILFDKAVYNGFPFKPTQIIQPWQFGHGETKATCLWLRGLPLLKPTNIVDGREARIHKMPPGPNRAKMRSETYQGIADAMVATWLQ